MSKNLKKPGLMDILTTGKKIWDEHGDEIIEAAGKIAEFIKKDNQKDDQLAQLAEDAQDAEENVIADVEGDEVEVLDSSSTSTLAPKPGTHTTVQTKNGKLIVIQTKDTEDTYFEDTLSTLEEAAQNGLESPEAAMEALKVLGQCASETVKYCAEQETKRVEILAKRDAVIAQINAVSAMVKDYLDRTFDERSKIFAKQFEVLDAALKNGDSALLSTTLNGINSLAASSPFKNLADITQVQQSLSAGTEWDI